MNRLTGKRLAGPMTIAAVIAVLTACGGGSSGADATASSGSVKSLKGQTVEVAAIWTDAEQHNFQKVLDAFAAQTGATMKYTPTGPNVSTFLDSRVAGGQPPDVAMLPQQGSLIEFAKAGKLKPLKPAVVAALDTNFAPIWKQLGSSGGVPYGVYFKAANKSTVWYRPKAFTEAGIQPPKTWSSLVTDAQTLSDAGTTPIAIGGADGWTLTDWFENIYLSQAGPEKYDQLSQHQIPWTDPSVKQALTTLAQLWGKPDLLVGGTKGALQTEFAGSVTQTFADPPKAAMVYEGDFVAGVITDSTKAKVGTDAEFFPFPAVGAQPPVMGGGDVAVAFKDTPAASQLLEYLASPKAAEIWAALGGFTSPNTKVNAAAYPDDVTRRIALALVASGSNFRFDMSDLAPAAFGGTKGAGEWKALQDFLKKPTDVDAAAAALETEAAKAFK